MTTIFVATTPDEVRNLFPWARASADSRNSDLVLLLPMRRKGETRVVAASQTPEEDDSELIVAAREALREGVGANSSESPIQLLLGEDWKSDLVSALADQKPSFVVVPAPTISKDQSADDDWQTNLLENIDSDVLMLRDDSTDVCEGVRLAIFVTDSADNETALDYAARLTQSNSGTATAVYVQPEISNESASIGRRQLDNMLQRIVRRSDRSALKHRVVVAKSISDGLKSFNARDFDLLLIGSRDLREIRRFLSADVTGNDGDTGSIPAVAVLKRGESFSNRFVNRIGRAIRSVVPQLSREERINLATRIQDSSKWDFDFILLISLATLIACFGLAENSGAVIVGAMLVAPLMTPIAGVGLGVAHANLYLTKVAFRTALRGFATAILIGAIFGLLVQMISGIGWLEPLLNKSTLLFPSEMENRTRPQFYDLLIALASGVAAAYAMGRPNLYSALPGVAIAAALVPPIATSGIALSHGDIIKGGGALLLFVTNMVTIILGTSLVFRAVGVKSQKDGPNAARWPRYVLLLLVVLSVIVTVAIEIHRLQR